MRVTGRGSCCTRQAPSSARGVRRDHRQERQRQEHALNLISGIDRPDSGAVWLDGQNLVALDERRTPFRRRHIGFVFQFFNLIPTLTVWENVVLPLELGGGVGPEARERAESSARRGRAA